MQEDGLVISIEPDPRNIALLQANTASYPQVVVIEAAYGRTKGMRYLSQAPNPLLSSLSRDESGEAVTLATLDDIFDEILFKRWRGRKYFCKIDVEGAGLEVLSGGGRFLEAFRPEVVVEASESELKGLRKLVPSHTIKELAHGYYHLIPRTSEA